MQHENGSVPPERTKTVQRNSWPVSYERRPGGGMSRISQRIQRDANVFRCAWDSVSIPDRTARDRDCDRDTTSRHAPTPLHRSCRPSRSPVGKRSPMYGSEPAR